MKISESLSFPTSLYGISVDLFWIECGNLERREMKKKEQGKNKKTWKTSEKLFRKEGKKARII